MSNSTKKYKKNPEIIDSNIDDEVVMMNIDTGAYFGLDSVASAVWGVLSEPHSLDELVAKLVDKYDVTQEKCREDTLPMLDQLVEAGVLELIESE